ncbi:MAG TPA: IPT/TIG domain-containing protein [Casimicrobiaceae bacterium]|jgi:hypothetical protein
MTDITVQIANPNGHAVTVDQNTVEAGSLAEFVLDNSTADAWEWLEADCAIVPVTQVVEQQEAGWIIVNATADLATHPGSEPDAPSEPPAITDVSPDHGPKAGGTSVVLTGSGLASVTDVVFAGTPATFTVDSDEQITAVTGATPYEGTNSVTVSDAAGNSDSAAWTYDLTKPAPAACTPSNGPVAGETPVSVTGERFTGATAVRFGMQDATALVVVDDTELTCTTPAQAGAGAFDVYVITPAGEGTLGAGFTYE